MRPSRVPAGVAHGSGMTLPDVYLEVQHPCRSCNSSSSSANAPAGVRRWEPVRESGLLPPRPRRLLRPRGRRRARRSRRRRSAQTQRWTVSGHTRMAGSSGNGTRGLPPTGGGDQPRPGHSSTRAHGHSHDRRWRLRGLARLRPALRRAGPAMQHPPVHGPVLSRFGRHGRQDPFSSDGNPRVASDLPADAGRAASQQTGHLPDVRAVADLDLDDLAFLFRQVRHPLGLVIRTISNLTGVALSIRQRDPKNVLYLRVLRAAPNGPPIQ